jgi:ubiquinone/menaquinone biosynthesis C-methylase UbiE
MENIFLPGLNSQLNYVIENINIKDKKVLVIGTFSESIAIKFAEICNNEVELIVPDFASLISSKVKIEGKSGIKIRIMDYTNTDFEKETFDFIYAQASVSTKNRRKILKELKRISKPDSIIVIGEIYSKTESLPVFMKNALDNSNLQPIFEDHIIKFYEEVGFEVRFSENHDKLLMDYYFECKSRLNQSKDKLTDNEQSYYKKLLKKISHESNLFIKFNAIKYIGFKILELRRK